MDIHTPLGFLKQCSRCQHIKASTEFHKSPTTRDKLQSRCKECQRELADQYRKAHPERRTAQHRAWRAKQPKGDNARRAREWRKKNPERAKDHDLKRVRKVPLGTYSRMLEAQGGRCAVCGTAKAGGRGRFHLDHCHNTNTLRGLLCHSCNLLMGHAKDNPDLLRAAINYLRKNSAK